MTRFFRLCTQLTLIVTVSSCDTEIHQLGEAAPPGQGETPAPLVVEAVEPEPGRVEIGPAFHWRATFSTTLDRSTIEDSVILTDAGSGEMVPGSTELEAGVVAGRQVLVFRPDLERLSPSREYALTFSSTLESSEGAGFDPGAPEHTATFPLPYETFQVVPEMEGAIEAAALSCVSMRVSWETVLVEDNSPPEAMSYRVFTAVDPESIDTGSITAEAPPGSTDMILDGLEPNTSYRVALVAVDPVGNASPLSNEVAVETPPEDRCELIPPEFSGIRALEVDPARPQVLIARWEAASDNETPPGEIRYNAYVATEPGEQDFSLPFRSSRPGALELELDRLIPDATYYVVVRAVDASTNEDDNSVELAATTPLSFSINVLPILKKSLTLGGCSSPFCHGAPANAGGLNTETHRALVIVGGVTRNPPTIVPGDSEGSYFLWRTDESNPNYVTGRSRMPLGRRQPMPPADLDTISRWIDAGALDN